MAGDGLRQPVRVSLVIYQVHRKALWSLRSGASMASASRIVRSLIRHVTPATVDAMQRHFAGTVEARGARGRFTRPSFLLDAADLARLDYLAQQAQAPSRSAATRFLILDAERHGAA